MKPDRAFVLAGGRSRRFETDKARHPVDGVPMALRVARALASSGLDVTLVARDSGLADLGLPVLVEPAGPVHALSGVLAALDAVGPEGRALIAPCDLPWLDAETVAVLQAGPPPRIAAGQPLLAWLPGTWSDTIRAWRDAGEPVRKICSHAVEVPLRAVALRNVNRRSDLETGPAGDKDGLG